MSKCFHNESGKQFVSSGYKSYKIHFVKWMGAEYEKAVEKTVYLGYNEEKVSKGVEQMKGTADNCAILKSDSQYTIFIFKDQIIRFATSSKLERYTEIKEWDKGYLVVMAKYKNLKEVEEYIDLIPILQNLYYDVDEFLAPIKEVQIDYAA